MKTLKLNEVSLVCTQMERRPPWASKVFKEILSVSDTVGNIFFPVLVLPRYRAR